MKRVIVSCLLAVLLSVGAFAQEQRPKVDPEVLREKIITKKKAIYTERLELTKKESEKFWPIYEKYDAELFKLKAMQREAHHKMRDAKQSKEDAELAEEYLDVCLSTEEQIAALTKEYVEQFKTVLPVQKVAKLMMEEKKIMRELTKCKKNKGKQCPK